MAVDFMAVVSVAASMVDSAAGSIAASASAISDRASAFGAPFVYGAYAAWPYSYAYGDDCLAPRRVWTPMAGASAG